MVAPPSVLFWLSIIGLIIYLFRIVIKRWRKDFSRTQQIFQYSWLAITLIVVIWGIVYIIVTKIAG